MSTDTDDVDVRCKQCGKSIGSATVRSTSQRSLSKMRWVLTRLLCPQCEQRK